MSFCKQCGAALEDEPRFCSQCGSTVSESTPVAEEKRFCVNCGAPMDCGGVFCPQCGASSSRRSRALARPYVGGWLVWSIITSIVFFPLGLGALAFSLAARLVADSYAEARSLARCAFLWNLVMWLLSVFGFFLVAIGIVCHLFFFGILASFF